MTINTENIFGKDGFVWFIGVVENRKDDPDRLGRVRVRIMGYHSDDLEILPQEELPWAIVMQPTTSAAISGLGSSPTNLVEGTWVIGFFLDGKEKQQPIIIGTVGGFTQRVPFCGQESTYLAVEAESVVRTSDGTPVVDSEGVPITTESGGAVTGGTTSTETGGATTPGTGGTTDTGAGVGTASAAVRGPIGPMSREQVQAVMDALGARESGNNYGADNRLGYVGKYQFGSAALEEQGLIRRGATREQGARAIYDDANWTNPAAPSLRSFLNNPDLQERVMYQNMANNYRALESRGAASTTDSPERVGGLLAAAHLGGAGGAARLARGSESRDAFGTSTRNYYDLGYTAVALNGRPGGTPAAVLASRRGIPADLAGAGFAAPTFAVNVSRIPVSAPAAQAPRPIIRYGRGADTDWVAENSLEMLPVEAFQDPEKKYPKCDYIDKPDTNKLATGDVVGEDTVVQRRVDDIGPPIPLARGAGSWEELPPAYCAEYPYNQVFETEAGHVVEFDNTPSHERIHIYHKSGTYIEIDDKGNFSKKVQGSDYEIVEKNKHLYVTGDLDVTVDRVMRLYVKGDAHVQVDGSAYMQVADTLDVSASEIFLRGEVNIDGPLKVKGSSIEFDVGKFTAKTGSTTITGAPVNINKGVAPPVTIAGAPELAPAREDDDPTPSDCELDPPIYEEIEVEDFIVEGETAEFSYTYTPRTDENVYEIYDPQYIEVAQSAAEERIAILGLGGPVADGAPVAETFVDPGNALQPVAVACADLSSITVFPPAIAMSRYFTFGALTSGIPATSPVTPQTGACNLRNLAVNTLDRIIERFPDMSVLTGAYSSVLPGFSFARDSGNGALMQFGDTPYRDYIDIAAWIRDNVPYSQLSLNYRNDTLRGLTSTIGVALGASQEAGPRVATVLDGRLYAPYLFSIL